MKKENEILEALKRGDTITDIIKNLHVCHGTVKKILLKYNLAEIHALNGKKGRPKSDNKRVRYSFRVPKPMADKIEAKIKAEGSTETKFFNDMLEKYSLIAEWGCGDE